MDLGQKLKTARTRIGLSQEAVAETIGVSRQTISNWENNRSYPDIASALKLSDLYGLSLDEMLKEDAGVRRRIEDRRERQRAACERMHDLGFLLMCLTFPLVHFTEGDSALTVTLTAASIVLICLSHVLLIRLFGADKQTVFLRLLGFALSQISLQLRFLGNHSAPVYLLFLAGNSLEIRATYLEEHKNRSGTMRHRRPTWFNGFVIALCLVSILSIPVIESYTSGVFSNVNPFGHEYLVEQGLYPEDSTVKARVRLTSGNKLRILQDGQEEQEISGEFSTVSLTAGQRDTVKAIWQLIPEDDSAMLYKLTVESDGSIVLSCFKNDQLQYKWQLISAETVSIRLTTALHQMYQNPQWYPQNSTDPSEPGFKAVDVGGSGKLAITIQHPLEDTLTLHEEYHHDNNVEAQTYTLPRNEDGSFTLDLQTRYSQGQQYALYRIPYTGGEYRFVLTFGQ